MICLLLSGHHHQRTWHMTAIQILALYSLPAGQERESKVTELVTEQTPAKFWVSEHDARRKQFVSAVLPS